MIRGKYLIDEQDKDSWVVHKKQIFTRGKCPQKRK
jgi:hypothetical protein